MPKFLNAELILRDAQNHLLRHFVVGGEPIGAWLYESGDGQAFRILALAEGASRAKGVLLCPNS